MFTSGYWSGYLFFNWYKKCVLLHGVAPSPPYKKAVHQSVGGLFQFAPFRLDCCNNHTRLSFNYILDFLNKYIKTRLLENRFTKNRFTIWIWLHHAIFNFDKSIEWALKLIHEILVIQYNHDITVGSGVYTMNFLNQRIIFNCLPRQCL